MGLHLYLRVLGGILGSTGGYARVAVSSMTIGTAEADGSGCVHRRAIGRGVAGHAACGLAIGVGLRLQ